MSHHAWPLAPRGLSVTTGGKVSFELRPRSSYSTGPSRSDGVSLLRVGPLYSAR